MKGVEPVEQVFSKLASLDQLNQIPIGGRYQANIEVHFTGAAYSRRFTLLNHTQQFGLNVQWQLTYLIEKQRAVVRFLENTRLVFDGARK